MDRSKTDLKKFHFIYRTTNLLNGRYYVGLHSTDDLSDNYIGSGVRLWNEVNKYGRENFRREILEFLPSRQELKAKERSLVNEEMLKDPLCINLKLGGEGGSHGKEKEMWQSPEFRERRFQGMRKAWQTNKGYRVSIAEHSRKRLAKLHEEGKVKYDNFTGKQHSDEAKSRIGAANSIAQAGNKNSQFGTCWVCNEIGPLKIKKQDLDNYLDNGYRRGRK